MTIRLILAFIIAFLVSSGIGAFLVPFLRKIKAGQAIREDGPRWHMSKSGTPTMGGLMFIAAIAVVCLSVGFECMAEGEELTVPTMTKAAKMTYSGSEIGTVLFQPLILLTLGIMYIIETLSDIIQVTYFKLSHGKRIFKMAPFHHHLEMGGWTGKKWTERELFVLYFSISLICAVISFVGVYNRYAF